MNLEKKFLVTMEMGFLEKIMSSANATLVKGKGSYSPLELHDCHDVMVLTPPDHPHHVSVELAHVLCSTAPCSVRSRSTCDAAVTSGSPCRSAQENSKCGKRQW